MLFDPIMHMAEIPLTEANGALARWEHKMGPCNRPNGTVWAHGLFHCGELAAVTVTAGLVRETCAGLTRAEAVELARLCAARPGLCRLMLRSWREFIFPQLAASRGWSWAVSYQDKQLHTGATYRFDGWGVLLDRTSSGTDTRSGRKGRVKRVWGWQLPTAKPENGLVAS